MTTESKVTPVKSKFDVNAVRQAFPALHQHVNGHPLIYFDNAATTQKPQSVIDTINHYYSFDNANVHRGVHELSERATAQYEKARNKVQHFIHAREARECIFVRGATEAINLVAHSFVAPRLQAGDEVLITEMEHHSNIVPWQLICERTGAHLKVVPMTDKGELRFDQFEHMLTAKTKFFAVGHVSNALGTIQPIKKMIARAHQHDVPVLIDGAQAPLHAEINVVDLDCDFYAFSGHKMMGPTGIGVLYGKAKWLESMIPYQGGGEMITRVRFTGTEYHVIPHKFEAGTPNIAGVIGLGAAIDYISQFNLAHTSQYEAELLRYATDAMQQIDGIKLIGCADDKVSIISFTLKAAHAHDVATILNHQGIAIRSGHHCAMPIMDHYGVAATSRASLCFYNTKAEIDTFIEALAGVREVFA